MEQLERRVGYERHRDRTGKRDPEMERGSGQHQLRRTLGRAVLALAPDQLRAAYRALTAPQRSIARGAVRSVLGIVRDQERER